MDHIGAMSRLPELPLLRLMLTFEAEERIVDLPPFRGAFWRGLFGRALKQLARADTPIEAVWPEEIATIGFGRYRRDSLYEMLFAPGEEALNIPAFRQPPPPFVVDMPGGLEVLRAGATELVGLTLIGDAAAEALPAVLAAFALAARDGLGGNRGRARLADAAVCWREPGGHIPVLSNQGYVTLVPADVPPVPPCPAEIEVLLATPLRLQAGRGVLGPETLHAADLLEALVRRTSLLQRAYGAEPLTTDFGALFALARASRMFDVDLEFAAQHRWSGHQRQEIDMGGVVGSFRLALGGIEPLWPYLFLGQWLHVGKGTAMGMGSIRLRD